MMATSSIPLIVGIGELIRIQHLIPHSHDKTYAFCILTNAAINIALSVLLIPVLGIFGTGVGTLVAELFGLFFQLAIILCLGI